MIKVVRKLRDNSSKEAKLFVGLSIPIIFFLLGYGVMNFIDIIYWSIKLLGLQKKLDRMVEYSISGYYGSLAYILSVA